MMQSKIFAKLGGVGSIAILLSGCAVPPATETTESSLVTEKQLNQAASAKYTSSSSSSDSDGGSGGFSGSSGSGSGGGGGGSGGGGSGGGGGGGGWSG